MGMIQLLLIIKRRPNMKKYLNEKYKSFKKWFNPQFAIFKKYFRFYWGKFHLTKWLIIAILGLILILSTVLTYQAKTADVKNLESSLSQTTKIYDVSDKNAGELYAQKGTYVKLNQISKNIPNAVLSTEDRNFYHEYGFSVKGLMRAFYLLVKNKILHRDYISGGGSTLTQQLVKNAYLSQEQTFSRKLKELFLSIQVENDYSKDSILNMYLNNAYFGNGVWGVQDASEKYFGTNASELSVPNAAVLAGMLTSPGTYNPIDHPTEAKERRNMVLQLMVENKKITQAQADYYKSQEIVLADNYVAKDGYNYPYYFDAVIDEAINKYGLTESEIMNKGYKIYTNLNQAQQAAMQNNFDNDSLFPANASDGTKVQAASIAVNPSNGGVAAVVGGRGEHVFRGYNRATQMKRQPGSTIKPIAVYAPALESGYNITAKLSDEKRSYGKNKYTPKNYNNVYQGEVPMYEALAQSMNAPAVWLLNQIGVNKGYQSVKNFGLPVTEDDNNLALALGGISTGFSPQQMAGAYTAFANEGVKTDPYYIRKIVDSNGNTVVDTDDTDSDKSRIISKDVADKMTSMMLGVFDNGTGTSAKPYNYSIAGKTGSTEADSTSSGQATKDKWIVGYTPDLVVATWEGFDSSDSTHYLENLSGVSVGPLFRNEMQTMLPYTSNTQFKVKDAQTISKTKTKTSFWDDLQNKASEYTDDFSEGTSSIKQKAEQVIDKAKSLFGQ